MSTASTGCISNEEEPPKEAASGGEPSTAGREGCSSSGNETEGSPRESLQAVQVSCTSDSRLESVVDKLGSRSMIP